MATTVSTTATSSRPIHAGTAARARALAGLPLLAGVLLSFLGFAWDV